MKAFPAPGQRRVPIAPSQALEGKIPKPVAKTSQVKEVSDRDLERMVDGMEKTSVPPKNPTKPISEEDMEEGDEIYEEEDDDDTQSFDVDEEGYDVDEEEDGVYEDGDEAPEEQQPVIQAVETPRRGPGRPRKQHVELAEPDKPRQRGPGRPPGSGKKPAEMETAAPNPPNPPNNSPTRKPAQSEEVPLAPDYRQQLSRRSVENGTSDVAVTEAPRGEDNLKETVTLLAQQVASLTREVAQMRKDVAQAGKSALTNPSGGSGISTFLRKLADALEG